MSAVVIRSLCLACVVPTFAALAHAEPTALIVQDGQLKLEPKGRAYKKLTIDNPLGNIIIEGHDSTAIQIETRKMAPDEDSLARLRASAR